MAHLSSEDFARLQNQLLELREKNYSLEDALRKNKKELAEAKAHFHALEEENARYQSLIRTSKKAGEVELLIRDNGYLRNKLKDQEEDFRLQNNTLLKELSKLVGENERYERQMEVLCGKQSSELLAEGDHGSTDDSKEVIRLRGELKEMEKRLFEAETQRETEKEAHMEKITSLNLQVTQLTSILQTHSIPLDEGEINLGKGGGVSFKKLTLHDDDGLETDLARTNDAHYQSLGKSNQLINELERVQKELREEKEHTSTLTLETTRLEECLKSANERLSSAMEEIENKNKEAQNRNEETERRIKKMENQCRTNIDTLKISLEERNSSLAECESRLDDRSKQLETAQHSLEQLENNLKATEKTLQDAQNAALQKDIECESLKKKVSAITEDITHIREQMEQSENKLTEFQGKVNDQHLEILSLKTSLVDQTKLAESRHYCMEEMRGHMDEEQRKHSQEIERLSDQHREEVLSLSTQNQQLKNDLEIIHQKINEMTDLNSRIMQLEQEKSKLEELNVKLSGDLEAAQKLFQEETDSVAAEKCQEIEKINWEWQREKNDLQTQLEISTIQRQEAEEAVDALKRKVADGEEEQRIHERKGVTLMKDLKKQLMSERKRADRLQEKLSQLLTDPAQLTAITTSSEAGDDVSSVSSWSLVSGEPRDSSTRENSIIASPQGSPPPGVVNEETVSLVNRLTELQQHKWQLEERITHLESSSAAMADDLLKKSAIIQHFCMEQKNTETTGSPLNSPMHLTPHGDKLRRVLEMMRGGADESLREVNRRLQNLLEETLGKNMQLHKDVENLSQQVHHLSKLAAVKTEAEVPEAEAAAASTV